MYSIGDEVVYPQHGAGRITGIEQRVVLGRQRDYLTIHIEHSDMTVMVPVENADSAGLRMVCSSDVVAEVLEVLRSDATRMPSEWNHRHKHNLGKLKTGDIFDVADVVRNLAARRAGRELPIGEKQMLTKAKRILASEFMYACDLGEDEAMAFLESVLDDVDAARQPLGDSPEVALSV
jgi:CarD family transcriptional regulator